MKLIKLWLPVIAWASLIFYLSSIPNLKTNLGFDFILRKIAHVIEYFIFTFLVYRAFQGSFKMGIFQLFIYPATLSFLYAASDEFHQLFVPTRQASSWDLLIDSIGILGFYIILNSFIVKPKN
jgi:VanZ family protein